MALTQITEKGIKDGEIINADINASAAIARTKLANVDLVDDTSPQLGGNLDVNTKNIVFGDSSDGSSDDVLKFGTGTDLSIYSDGSNGYITHTDSGGDPLYISSQNDIRLRVANTAEGIKIKSNGAVELYNSGTKRFETYSNGVNVSGRIQFTDVGLTDVIEVPDGKKVTMGSGGDLSIYHDGTKSYIDNNTGDLEITTPARIELQGNNGSSTMARYTSDGPVELFHANGKKLETTSSGIEVTGAVTASNHINFGNNTAKFMSGSSNQLQMYYDGSSAYINNTVASQLKFATNNTDRLVIDSSGNVAVQGGIIQFKQQGNSTNTSNGQVGGGNSSQANNSRIAFQTGSAVNNGLITFHTMSGGTDSEHMRIDSSGSLLIGATSYGGGGISPDLYISSTGARQVKIHNTNSSTSSLQLTNAATGQGDDNGLQIAVLSDQTAYINQVESASIRIDVNGSERLRVNSSGNVTVNTGNLVIGTSGKGIDFSATSDASGKTSELLDDYEEGSYTPSLSSGQSFNSSYDYVRYTKIGRQVTLTGQLVFQAYNSSSYDSSLTIGLPFANGDGNARSEFVLAAGCGYFNSSGSNSPNTDIVNVGFHISESSSHAAVFSLHPNYDTSIGDWVGNGSDIWFCLTYFTN